MMYLDSMEELRIPRSIRPPSDTSKLLYGRLYAPWSRYRVKGMVFTIGELGKATGTKVETIRYYERIGLIPKPARTEGNYRNYGKAELDRLSFVRRARDLGFSLDQVRALLELADDVGRDCTTVDMLAKQHLAEVQRKIADLTALQRELTTLIQSCHGGVVADCQIIQALAPVNTK